mgnify:CR=1 FL=1
MIVEGTAKDVIQYPIVTNENGLAIGSLIGLGTGEGPLSPDYLVIVVDEKGNEVGRQPGMAHIIEPVLFSETAEGKLKLEATK